MKKCFLASGRGEHVRVLWPCGVFINQYHLRNKYEHFCKLCKVFYCLKNNSRRTVPSRWCSTVRALINLQSRDQFSVVLLSYQSRDRFSIVVLSYFVCCVWIGSSTRNCSMIQYPWVNQARYLPRYRIENRTRDCKIMKARTVLVRCQDVYAEACGLVNRRSAKVLIWLILKKVEGP